MMLRCCEHNLEKAVKVARHMIHHKTGSRRHTSGREFVKIEHILNVSPCLRDEMAKYLRKSEKAQGVFEFDLSSSATLPKELPAELPATTSSQRRQACLQPKKIQSASSSRDDSFHLNQLGRP